MLVDRDDSLIDSPLLGVSRMTFKWYECKTVRLFKLIQPHNLALVRLNSLYSYRGPFTYISETLWSFLYFMRWYAQNKWKYFICYKNRKQNHLTFKTNTIIRQKHLDQQKFSTSIQLLPLWSEQLSPMRGLGIVPFGVSPSEVFSFSRQLLELRILWCSTRRLKEKKHLKNRMTKNWIDKFS